MRIKELLCERLKELGIDRLYVDSLKRKYAKSYMQTLAVKMLIENLTVKAERIMGNKIGEECGIELYGRGEETEVNYKIDKGEPLIYPPQTPFFLIDFNLWDMMTDEERKSTTLQFILTLNVIRNYLWDGNLGVLNAPTEFFRLFEKFQKGLKHSFLALSKMEIRGDNPIVLNPYGNIIADEEILRNSDTIILGGIVDKGRRIREATTELSRISGYYDLPQVKITLRGSIVGVPDRLNSIVEIVLKVKEGYTLEDAIISSQSKADKLRRLYYEMTRGNEDIEKVAEFLRAKDLLEKIKR